MPADRPETYNDRILAVMKQPLSGSLQTDLGKLTSLLKDCADVIMHRFTLGDGTEAVLIGLTGQSDFEQLERQVITPLLGLTKADSPLLMTEVASLLPLADSYVIQSLGQAVEAAFYGSPCLLMDGSAEGLALGLPQWEERGIEEPMAESVVRGPREGFNESLNTNISMLRRKLRTPAFKMKNLTLGNQTRTRIVVCYLESTADPELVTEVLGRLQAIKVDGVLESGNLEEMIEDSAWSPFPQLLSTERPDVAAASLLEGRVVILTDGTPISLVAPTSLFSLLQSPEDYYQRYLLGTLIRWLRYAFFLVALLFPSMYVAILTYHQEMVPTTLLLSISKSREDIPFPALVEAILMEITFEALREAGVRLPKQVGSAVSIVGALVIGQAATSAGLVSPPMVMVVALTGIASFMLPHYSVGISVRLLRFPVMLLAGALGLLGLMLGVIAIVIHLCQLRSFGQPYISIFKPDTRQQWKDLLVRAPAWARDGSSSEGPASESSGRKLSPRTEGN